MKDDRGARRVWAEHLLFCVPVLLWVSVVCGIPALALRASAWWCPGTAILLIRSFAEHKASAGGARAHRHRREFLDSSGRLFLFNNLHALHHEQPTIPWYRYPAFYRANRERLVQENGGLVYDSYLDVARRFLLSSHDKPKHPAGSGSARCTATALKLSGQCSASSHRLSLPGMACRSG